jgi:signal transduction histidine kinase
LIQRKQLEDELENLLYEMGVDNSDELAEDFVDFGFDKDEILKIASMVEKEELGAVLGWIGDNLMIEKMVNDIQESSERISKLIKSVKSYTHMDQSSDKKLVDLHEGIVNTINMLNYKIKSQHIQIELDFDKSIPQVMLFVSEVNQVWTNLIDNAIDAVTGIKEPKVTIRTWMQKNDVKICIQDNGVGIPPEIASRIWEPFFTTKSIGKGTGLGLELVQNIVEKHHGSIKMNSKPGSTSFELCFPIR